MMNAKGVRLLCKEAVIKAFTIYHSPFAIQIASEALGDEHPPFKRGNQVRYLAEAHMN
jgi:hypothetical protein